MVQGRLDFIETSFSIAPIAVVEVEYPSQDGERYIPATATRSVIVSLKVSSQSSRLSAAAPSLIRITVSICRQFIVG